MFSLTICLLSTLFYLYLQTRDKYKCIVFVCCYSPIWSFSSVFLAKWSYRTVSILIMWPMQESNPQLLYCKYHDIIEPLEPINSKLSRLLLSIGCLRGFCSLAGNPFSFDVCLCLFFNVQPTFFLPIERFCRVLIHKS